MEERDAAKRRLGAGVPREEGLQGKSWTIGVDQVILLQGYSNGFAGFLAKNPGGESGPRA